MKTASGKADLGQFDFACGDKIESLEVAYETYGEFNGDNAVLICHALTGSQNVAGYTGEEADGQARAWWNDIVGPGKAVDTTEYYVVCANVPGSCYGTTGPASTDSEGEVYATEFPPVTVGDWTRAQRQVLDTLGVGRLRAVVGGSVGGMNALDWARRYPDDAECIIAVAAAARLDAQSLALDAIARRAITTDPDWNDGEYYTTDTTPTDGLAVARQIGHVMYLSKSSMQQKFSRRAAGRDARRDSFPVDPAAAFFPYRDVESYLDYQAEKFVERFDPNSYLYLTRAMDDYDLAEGYEDDARAIAAFEGETLLVSFTGDWHFTTEQSETLAESFRSVSTPVAHHVIESDHGHDAFLVEPDKVGPPLRDFLADGINGRAVHDTAESSTDDDNGFAPVHASLFSR
ncbi:homoserine O-acetyltransferase [Haloquadratum walsbyi]|jgi:homoserine O-acetyltransferase (EC 2.3.1.31)|uniref:Homoserine O-acetyltransferase n=1 Tax=Haloquadratum walsbyi J07HQW2 TaxID=1238425 RepID=U1PQ59_9EURY|nr:homoserine O-acetyltransferase [Haloquadratum walsbyi]ERG95877.1 MAG: homoserine O-acetyltransferase [Haloquadratum walsbyi J07HQW2]